MSRLAQAIVPTLLGALLVPFSASCGGGSEGQARTVPKSPADAIRDTERARIHALVVNDMTRARALHADDFILEAPNGETYTKARYLNVVGAGRLDYVIWEPISPIRVGIRGDEAEVSYRSKIGFAGNFGGTTEQTHHDTYERRGGRWVIVRSVTVFDS